MNQEQIRDFIREEIKKQVDMRDSVSLHHSRITPKLIKQRHLEDKIIKFGDAANLPTDNTEGVSAYFAEDTDTLYLYGDGGWVSVALS